MITGARIRNFKCLLDNTIELRPLTVFCGGNSVGKSSITQCLLIAKKFSREAGYKTSGTISLNDVFGQELGTVADVVSHRGADDDARVSEFVEISIFSSKCLADFKLNAAPATLLDSYISGKRSGQLPPPFRTGSCLKFFYLAADRIGPRDTHPVQSRPIQWMEVGPSGAFAPEVLAKLERKKVRRELRHPSALSLETLLPQVEQWMGDWIPGINIRAESSEDANRASVRFRHKGIKSEWKRPANVGFGASYSLPIVLTGLLAPRGSIIIVDTPEAHLHPAGQAAMAKFLSQVSASGVQVIIETHSDHIINGIRICAADKSHPLEPHDVVINSLAQAPEAVKIEKIEINEYGSLNKWPKGFLDQTEMDLAAISRIARGL